MPVYRQDRDYEEEMAEEPVADEEETEETSEAEEPEDGEEEEEKEKPKQKKTKKKTKHNTKMVVALAMGSTALLVLVAVAAIGIKTKQNAAAERKAQKEEFEQMIAESKAYAQSGETASSDAQEQAEDEQPATEIAYSDQELKALRKWGYTASEIEVASQQGLSAKELADSAREDREEAQKEALAAVSDTASDEYKNLLHSTWLGGEDLDVSSFTNDFIYTSASRVENVDYEKCAAKNEQCFIRLNLDNGKPAFMYISPDRYNELPDTGNMVVEITTVQSGDIEVITNITEQRVN